MTTPMTNAQPADTVQTQVSGVVRGARLAYLVSTALFAGGVILQVFFAGATLLADASYLIQHRSFAHLLEPVTLAIPIIGLFARLPRRLLLLSWLPLVLFALQYVFLYAVPSAGLPTALRALHAVNALLIFWVALHLTNAAWGLVRESARKPKD